MKNILFVFEYGKVSREVMSRMSEILEEKGYAPLYLTVPSNHKAVDVFSLDHLPAVELDELKKLIEEKAHE